MPCPRNIWPTSGLVPLFLACMAAVREWRRDPSVRLWRFLQSVTLLLSLGPYVPGFRYLIKLPGFSFFRAPSRWSVATALALALLAGKGFDRWRRMGTARPVALAAGVDFDLLGGGDRGLIIELALLCTGKPGWPEAGPGVSESLLCAALEGGPELSEAVLRKARRPLPDPRIASGIPHAIVAAEIDATSGYSSNSEAGFICESLARRPCWFCWFFLAARLSEKAWLAGESRRGVLFCLTFLDLWVLGRHRLIDVAP